MKNNFPCSSGHPDSHLSISNFPNIRDLARDRQSVFRPTYLATPARLGYNMCKIHILNLLILKNSAQYFVRNTTAK